METAKAQSKRYCTICGAASSADATFCRSCGRVLEIPGPPIGRVFCERCGGELSLGDSYCPTCGEPQFKGGLVKAEASQPPAPTPSAASRPAVADDSVVVEDVTSQYACFGLWGPRARDILQRVTKSNISNAAFPYMTAQHIAVGDVPTLAVRVTYVGELGWEFYCPMEYGQRLWDVLWEAGQPDGVIAAGYRAIDSLRLEKGYRYWSADISPDYTPYEAGLSFAVKLDKGNFIGRDALVKQKNDGIQRKLCCLTLADATSIALGNEPVRAGEQVVGWVTSGGYGYAVRKNIAYAYLPLEHAALGTALDVELLGERIAATVDREPLWDPKGERVKA